MGRETHTQRWDTPHRGTNTLTKRETTTVQKTNKQNRSKRNRSEEEDLGRQKMSNTRSDGAGVPAGTVTHPDRNAPNRSPPEAAGEGPNDAGEDARTSLISVAAAEGAP